MHDASGRSNHALERGRRRSVLAVQRDRLRDMLARRPFLKNVSIMLTGSAVGQLASVLLSPILTRLYSPQQLGILSVYTAILAILVVVASLRYELALPLVASEEEAINLMAVCGCALIASTVTVAVAAFAFPEDLLKSLWPNPFHFYRMAGYRGFLILGFVCLGRYYIALYFTTRQRAFQAMPRTRIYPGVTVPLSQ